MHKTDMISTQDARGVYKLSHEICELGFDPVLWRHHLLEGLNRLVDAQVAIGVDLQVEATKSPVPVGFYDLGWSCQRDRRVFLESFDRLRRDGDYAQNPFYSGLNLDNDCLVMAGGQTLSLERYQRLPFYNECVRLAGGEDMLGVCSSVVNGQKLVICVHRPLNSPAFSRREMTLAKLLMQEVSVSLGSRLTAVSTPGIMRLSRRKRQVLLHLLQGESEKQIAARLAVSRYTVHEYITAIYKHYRVSDRAELLSRFIDSKVIRSIQKHTDTMTRRVASANNQSSIDNRQL